MSERFRFDKTESGVELRYFPHGPLDWLAEDLLDQDTFVLGRIFYFNKDELGEEVLETLSENPEEADEPLILPFATTKGNYYKIPGRRLGIKQNVYFEKGMTQSIRNFRAARQVSIFKQIAILSKEDIYIGGKAPTAIPKADFGKIIKAIPTDYELRKYVSARISGILSNYLDYSENAVESYQKYLDRKPARVSGNVRHEFAVYELAKFEEIQKRLLKMLREEDEYSESTWQEGIKDILLLVYPQYLKAFREAPILGSRKGKSRSVDFLLVDSSGTVDLLEIKKPFDMSVVTARTYRDNYIPLRELSGSVMQVEKYLFYLTRSGVSGEKKLNNRFGNELPRDLKIRVTNPRGFVLIGRDNNLSSDQRLDFEVIRRKYRNVIDIITYDDLLRRLGAITAQFRGLRPRKE